MDISCLFFVNSILFGIGLSMDSFSISLVNGISEPDMPLRKGLGIALVFAFFQALMPMIGWTFMHTLAMHFALIDKVIPYISCLLLCGIGISMIRHTCRKPDESVKLAGVCFSVLILQGISTSLDALSVGIAITKYALASAAVCVTLIALVTFAICMAGIFLGRRLGIYFVGQSERAGGLVLIAIGLEILIRG